MSDVSMSEDISAIALALNQLQMGLPTVTKDSVNPFFNSQYASLKAVVQAALPLLTAEGLSVAQFPTKVGLKTYLLHTSGQWIAEEMALHGQDTPQGQGSAITYARRYAFCSVLGIVVDDDDDANLAQAQQVGRKIANEMTQTAVENTVITNNPSAQVAAIKAQAGLRSSDEEGITEKQGKALWAISKGGKAFSLAAVCSEVYGKAEKDLTKKEASALIDGLNNGSIDTSPKVEGAKAVAAAFPGAIVQNANEVEGYNGEPF